MKWLSAAAAVIVGYGLAALANMLWVVFWYPGDRDPGAAVLVAPTLLMFGASGLLAGAFVARVAGGLRRPAAMVAAALVALAGLANLSMGVAAEPAWHTLLAMGVQAPALLLGARMSRASGGAARTPS